MKSFGKYVRVFDVDRNCFIFEHDKVWLDYNGYTELKSITEYKDGSYIIHHINGNRGDNRIENLQLMSRSEHAKLHATLRESDYCEKISKTLTGRKRSLDTCKKISVAQKLNPSKSMLGRHHSEETKQKIRESNITAWQNKSQSEKDRLNENNRLKHLGKPAPNKGIPCPKNQRERLSEYWNSMYQSGYVAPSTGRIYVTNGIENCQIYPEDLQEYLKRGYRKGLTRGIHK